MDNVSQDLLTLEPQLRVGAFLGGLLIILILERLYPIRALSQSVLTRWSGNFGISVLSTLAARLLAPIAPVAAATVAEENSWGLFNLFELQAWITVAVSILVLDLVIYVQHRAFHMVPVLWRVHRMHHADLELDVTTGLRFHPIEILLSLIIKVGVVVAIGAPAVSVLAFEIILNGTAMFNHGNLRIPPGVDRWLRWIVVTPLMHRVHHSIVRTETDSNFGFNLPWWDRLLGTYRAAPAAGYDAMTIGLPEFREAGESRLDRLIVQPFIDERP